MIWALVSLLLALAVAFGVLLTVAAYQLHVKTDPRVDEVWEALPQLDWRQAQPVGAGGHPTAVAHIMGAKLADEGRAVRAVVHCQGGTDKCGQRFEYSGLADCDAAHMVQGGPKACLYGCLGYGNPSSSI